MGQENVNTKIPVIFQNIEEFNSEDTRFLKVRIWLMHTGVNLNGSYFDKEVVKKAIPSLSNTPIIAFIEEGYNGELDYSDHRMDLVFDDEGSPKLKYIGSAVGVIPESNNATWEKRITDSGEEKEYLVVDGLMWTKWDDATDIMKKKQVTAQSMELDEGYTGFFDDKGVFHFESFKFYGACLLGNGVLPAMENSTAEIQFSNKNNINKTIEEKIEEFYKVFSLKGGQELVENVQEQFEISIEDALDIKTSQEENKVEEEVSDIVIVEETPEEVLEEPVVVDEVDEEPTSEPSGEVEVDTAPEADANADADTSFSLLQSDYEALKVNYESLEEEVVSLRSYKRERELGDLKAKFSSQLTDSELDGLFTTKFNSSIEELELEIYAMIGKKNFSLERKSVTNKVQVASPKVSSTPNPYGDIFENL